jgi:hypothetical protein
VKSVTIKDTQGRLLVKVLHRKGGRYVVTMDRGLGPHVDVSVRGNDGRVVLFKADENAEIK